MDETPTSVEPIETTTAPPTSEGTRGAFFAEFGRAEPVERPQAPSTQRYGTLREFHSRYPGEYIEPETAPGPVEPFADPRDTVGVINPHYQEFRNYQVNCADCARAVESTWRGQTEQAAGRLSPPFNEAPPGESPQRLEEWTGRTLQPVDQTDLAELIGRAGHGSSAIIEVTVARGNRVWGHAFNLVNHHDSVLAVDGQTGEVWDVTSGRDWFPSATWPERTEVLAMRAIAWDKEGTPL